MRIRQIDQNCKAEIEIVAQRMRQTLVEVLGEEEGGSMYTMEWLIDRVNHHLDPSRCTGAVYIAEDESVLGHTIVRIENDEMFGEVGLFSTTYVVPEARRRGVAALLLETGENWMRERNLPTALTYTDAANKPLQELYLERGYSMRDMPNNFVALHRSL